VLFEDKYKNKVGKERYNITRGRCGNEIGEEKEFSLVEEIETEGEGRKELERQLRQEEKKAAENLISLAFHECNKSM
jgi:hypothetical protein